MKCCRIPIPCQPNPKILLHQKYIFSRPISINSIDLLLYDFGEMLTTYVYKRSCAKKYSKKSQKYKIHVPLQSIIHWITVKLSKICFCVGFILCCVVICRRHTNTVMAKCFSIEKWWEHEMFFSCHFWCPFCFQKTQRVFFHAKYS